MIVSYFLNISKTDYINDKKHLDEVYTKYIQTQDIWKSGFTGCERLLKKCIERNNLNWRFY